MSEPVMHIRLEGRPTDYKMLMFIDTPLTPREPEQEVTVEGLRLSLVAGDDGEMDSLITFIPNVQPTQPELLAAEYLNFRTLSALVWKYQRPFSQHLGFGGSPHLAWQGKPRPNLPRAGFYDLDDLQYPPQPQVRRSLAFYRQGLTQKDVFFKFLGFYRVVELIAGEGRILQVNWINGVIPAIQHSQAGERIQELGAAGQGIGEYLYVSGRSAIAHSGADPNKPVADPDSPEDFERIIGDLPLVQVLAKYTIRDIYRIPTLWGQL